MHGRLLCSDKARAHVHTFRAKRECGNKAASIGHSARGNERNFKLFGCARQQDKIGHIIFAGMPTAFKAIDRDSVTANRLSLHAMANRGAFVDDLDSGLFEERQHSDRIIPRRLNRFHPAVDNRLHIAGVIGRIDHRQECEVHPEWLIRHIAAFGDFVRQQFGGFLGQTRYDAKPACV